MAKKELNNSPKVHNISSTVDELLLAALERNDNTNETGRYLATFKDSAGEEGLRNLGNQGMRIADSRDFNNSATILENAVDADAVVFNEIGVALIGGNAAQERNMHTFAEIAEDSPIESIDPEYFVFGQSEGTGFLLESLVQETPKSADYLRGFLKATELIAKEMQASGQSQLEIEEEIQSLGATWGLVACKVPQSSRSGQGIKVAVLDTGMDLSHPDFIGRSITSATFVGQPVPDLHSHGTHLIGTACGPKSPPGVIPRYGIGYKSSIFAGKVLSNSGGSVGASVLAGINWAISNRCQVILLALGGMGGVQPSYTAAGQAALNNGCLIIAASGGSGGAVGYPANSPTIMSVAALDPTLAPSSFSSIGKIEIAAPGRDIFSSVPKPTLYGTKSGTSSASAHVAGCAALWAETSPSMRGLQLWRKLQLTARHLPFPVSRVGAGLVQAP